MIVSATKRNAWETCSYRSDFQSESEHTMQCERCQDDILSGSQVVALNVKDVSVMRAALVHVQSVYREGGVSDEMVRKVSELSRTILKLDRIINEPGVHVEYIPF